MIIVKLNNVNGKKCRHVLHGPKHASMQAFVIKGLSGNIK